MSDQEQDSAEKEHDPTPSKLDQARKEGDVAKSTDLMTGVALAGFLLVTSFSGNLALDGATEAQEFLRHAAAIAEAGAMAEASTALLRATALPALLLLLLPGLAALLSLVAQRGLVFAPARIKPRLSRISLNSPEFLRHLRVSSSAAVRTRLVTAFRSSHACASGCRTSRCNRTRPAWLLRGSDRFAV